MLDVVSIKVHSMKVGFWYNEWWSAISQNENRGSFK